MKTIILLFLIFGRYPVFSQNAVHSSSFDSLWTNMLIERSNEVADCKTGAIRDIHRNNITVLISGQGFINGKSDTIFENKYAVKYYHIGCLILDVKCITAYNNQVFDYLNQTYGKTWASLIRRDAVGLKEWEKKQ